MLHYDAVAFSNISADTSNFQLLGGKYMFEVIGTGFGTVTLQKLGPDGTTYLSVSSALAANGGAVLDLPPGQYKVAITTTTAVYASISRIPEL